MSGPTISAADFERALEVVRSADAHLRRAAVRGLREALAAADPIPDTPAQPAPNPTPRPVRRLVVSSGSRISAPGVRAVGELSEVRTRSVVEGESRVDVEVRWAIEVIAAGLAAGAAAAAAASDQQRGAHLQRELVLSVLVAFATSGAVSASSDRVRPPRGGTRMPQQAWSKKRERQYEHIKEGLLEQGRSEDKAEEIAARTVNKERARAGEARQRSKTSTDDISSGRRGGLRSGTRDRRAVRRTSSTKRRSART